MAQIGAVCSGSTLFATLLHLSVMLGNYLQQTTSADNIFRCIFFLGALKVNTLSADNLCKQFGPSLGPAKCGADLDPNCLTLWWNFERIVLKMLFLKKYFLPFVC